MRKPTGKARSAAGNRATAQKSTGTKTASKKSASKKSATKTAASPRKKIPSRKAAPPREASAPVVFGAKARAAPLGCCTIRYMDGASESRNGVTEEACRELPVSNAAIAATHWQKGVCA